MKLVGDCNRCGSCCVVGGYRCINLHGKPPGPTTCAVYKQRYDGMPIVLTDTKGDMVGGVCRKDSLDETISIIKNGFGRGCSLRLANEQDD